jgi:hypothetical protein
VTTGRYYKVRARQCALQGFNLPATTDNVFIDCAARGCGGSTQPGWTIGFVPNSIFVACRSEFSGTNGFTLNNGGGFTMTACSTDRNAQSGFAITGAGPFSSTQPIILVSPQCRRDGSGGTGSGIAIVGAVVPVIVESPNIWSGVNDGGGGTNSPAFGVTVQNASYVDVRGPGYVQVATGGTPLRVLGGNTYVDVDMASIITATGTNTSSPPGAGSPTFAQQFTTLANANLANGWTIGGSFRFRSVGRYLEMVAENVISPAVGPADGTNLINAGVLPAYLAPATAVRVTIDGLANQNTFWQFETTGAVTGYGFAALVSQRVDGVLRVPLD